MKKETSMPKNKHKYDLPRYFNIFDDKLSLYYLLYEYRNMLAKYYAMITLRDYQKSMIKLPAAEGKDLQSVLDSVSELSIIQSQNKNDENKSLKKVGGEYYLEEQSINIANITERLAEDSLITEKLLLDKKIKLLTVKENGFKSQYREEPTIGTNIKETLLRIADKFPFIKYLEFELVLNAKREWLIYQINNLYYLDNKYLKKTIFQKKLTTSLKEQTKKIMKFALKNSGWQDYMYRNWLLGLMDDWRDKSGDYTIFEKLWANRLGFYSYRIEQYGLNKENYSLFLSDRDYKWLRQINNYYRKWFRDKIQFNYILKQYSEYLPKYYFYLIFEPNGLKIINCKAQSSQNNVEDIIGLLIKVSNLALKPVISVHGKGFYKLNYHDQSFFINEREVSKFDLSNFLLNLDRDYIVSEYIESHQQINKIYNKATSTIRLMVINTDGSSPQIVSAYLRIANSKSGTVDNIAAGGISVSLNHRNGKILKAEMLINHQYIEIDKHPDTNQQIIGKIPNWEELCQVINSICLYLSPIEYLGFDLVLCDYGFKILEINMHQELHKYPDYDKSVKQYLENKLKLKRDYHNKIRSSK